MPYQLMTDEEKKSIFDRLNQIENQSNEFIDEAHTIIETLIEKVNELNERILKLEEMKK